MVLILTQCLSLPVPFSLSFCHFMRQNLPEQLWFLMLEMSFLG
jgi:hypothetical protein